MSNPLNFLAPLANNTYIKENSTNTSKSNYGVTQVTFNDIAENTELRRHAMVEARNREDMTALSVMLGDYGDMCQFDNNNGSCTYISRSDLKDYNIFEKIGAGVRGIKLNNFFRNDELQECTDGPITRKSIYQQELFALEEEFVNSGYEYDEDLKRGANQAEIYFKDVSDKDVRNGLGIGLRYAESDDDIYLAALNLAKADIDSIESAYSLTQEGKHTKVDGFLNTTEMDSQNRYRNNSEAQRAMMDLDLDGDRMLSAEEYANYILAVDTDKDGILTSKEVAWANENFEEIKELVKNNYKDNNTQQA